MSGREVTTLSRGTLVVDGGTVGYRSGGQGPVTVLVGSIAESTAPSRPLLVRLAATGTVIAVDPPGYGLSAPPVDDASIEDRADHLDRVLDALGVSRAALIGRDSGGLVALQLARTTPERYRAVVLDRTPLLAEAERRRWAEHYAPEIPVTLDGGHLPRHWMLRRLELLYSPWFDAPGGVPLDADLTDPDALDHQMHDVVLDRLAAGDAWADPYRAAFAYDPAPALRSVTVPVLLLAEAGGVVGRVDPVDPPGGADATRPTVTVVDLSPGTDRDEMLASLVGRFAPVAEPLRTPRHRPQHGPSRWTSEVASTPWGQIVARRHRPPAPAPCRRPLVMLHASPLSGVSLLDLGAAFATTRPVTVLDTLGGGDSDKPDRRSHPELRSPRIGDYAAAAGTALDDLGVGPVDLYGTHTGALIAIELAIGRPELVDNLVVNGVPLFDPGGVDGALTDYFFDMAPRWDGAHLTAAWSFTVEVMLWYPWHVRDSRHRRSRPNLDPRTLHERFVQLVKGGTTYADAQRAALVHPTARRLGEVRVRTLVCSVPGDPLMPCAPEVARLAHGAEQVSLLGSPEDATPIAAWLDAGPSRGTPR